MKILKIIGIIVGLIILAGIIWMMTWPTEAHLERTATINAPVEKVFNVVNDFTHAKNWNPWMKIDPEAKYTYGEITAGTGAFYSWTSENDQVGTGRQDILESIPNERVKTKMEFGGMNGIYTADFILEADGENTKLTWTYDGKGDEMMDKFFMSMIDSFLGSSYDQGIADLKTYIEGLPEPEMEETIESDSTAVVEEASTE